MRTIKQRYHILNDNDKTIGYLFVDKKNPEEPLEYYDINYAELPNFVERNAVLEPPTNLLLKPVVAYGLEAKPKHFNTFNRLLEHLELNFRCDFKRVTESRLVTERYYL